jgi:cyclopropane-fatty-acyl-phospholipid synthase
LLKPGGLFLNHGISCPPLAKLNLWNGFVNKRIVGITSFSQCYFFPDGELIPVSEVNLFAERAGFEVRDVEDLREHYALTLRHWVRRMEVHQDEMVKATDLATYRTWHLFMAACAYNFSRGNNNINQSLLSKPELGNSHLPLTRSDIYQSGD